MQRLRDTIDLADELRQDGRAPAVVSMVGGRSDYWGRSKHRVVERVHELGEYSASRDVVHALEMHSGTCVDSPRRALWRLEQVNHPFVGHKDGCLHIDSDGTAGQFTQYVLRPPGSTDSAIDLTVEAKVLENAACAATFSVPYVGKFRLYPDRVEVAHDPTLLIRTSPDTMHTCRIVYRKGHMQLRIDGEVVLDTDSVDARTRIQGWVPARPSVYLLAFGNERDESYDNPDDSLCFATDVAPWNITSRVTGHSQWRRVELALEGDVTGRHIYPWSAEKDGFPDQYQLDHMVEIEGSAIGSDQGYSGWTELDDGRIFVVDYTDDATPPCIAGGQDKNGIP